MPSAASASIAAPFSRATASTLAMNSRCSRCALLTRVTVGRAIVASREISPGWFMPSSTTAARCVGRRRSRVSGRPMSLLKLPSVAKPASPCQARKMAAIICVTVVLPLLPVTATSGRSKRCRQAAASWPRARRESATSSPGRPASARPRSANAATAPAALAWTRKSCASKRSPRKATNRSPGRRRAGVAVHPGEGERRIADQLRARQAGRGLAERRHRRRPASAARAASAASACAASENGCLTPPMSW